MEIIEDASLITGCLKLESNLRERRSDVNVRKKRGEWNEKCG